MSDFRSRTCVALPAPVQTGCPFPGLTGARHFPPLYDPRGQGPRKFRPDVINRVEPGTGPQAGRYLPPSKAVRCFKKFKTPVKPSPADLSFRCSEVGIEGVVFAGR